MIMVMKIHHSLNLILAQLNNSLKKSSRMSHLFDPMSKIKLYVNINLVYKVEMKKFANILYNYLPNCF